MEGSLPPPPPNEANSDIPKCDLPTDLGASILSCDTLLAMGIFTGIGVGAVVKLRNTPGAN